MYSLMEYTGTSIYVVFNDAVSFLDYVALVTDKWISKRVGELALIQECRIPRRETYPCAISFGIQPTWAGLTSPFFFFKNFVYKFFLRAKLQKPTK